MFEFLQLMVGALQLGAIYSLAASGFVVIHKATKTVNFAHGALIMLGAYGAFASVTLLKLPYVVAYLAVPVAVGIVAALVEWLILRPLRRADIFSVIMATVFLGVGIMELIRLAYQTELLSIPPVFHGTLLTLTSGIAISKELVWISAGAVVTVVLAIVVFERLAIGRGMRAMASNYRGAQLCGYSVPITYASAWFFGGYLAGMAGVFLAPAMGISPDLATALIVPAFVAAVIGGFDSLRGVIVGGFVLAIMETLAAAYISSPAKSAASFVLVFIMLLIRPQGLFTEGARRNA
ncbi:MAG: branched-chain amino acid transport system / permease component family protein [Candidatus Eremiobacteraeota bacterium]|jgi:branched-chain amino acid transport system permease protein|nr:branched-chain amino acid transport system / permease component family protein [Candidatus Eremiobacteraeota bacterium]